MLFRGVLDNKKGTGIGACRTGVAGFEPTNDGVKVRCLTAWLYPNGGGGQIRTAEPEGADLQSAAFSLFATLPYVIKKWRETESNRRHMELQSIALPTELPSLIAGAGFEPTAFGL